MALGELELVQTSPFHRRTYTLLLRPGRSRTSMFFFVRYISYALHSHRPRLYRVALVAPDTA